MNNSTAMFDDQNQCDLCPHHHSNQYVMKTELTKNLPSMIAMWEFFNENLHFKLSKFEFVEGGIKVIYVALHDEKNASEPKRLS